MKAYVIFSSSEPVLIVTKQSIRNEAVLNQLGHVGIHKFISREVPVSHLRTRYGRQFEVIEEALQTGSDLRVLDFSGPRIFENLPFSEFGASYRRESNPALTGRPEKSPRAAFRPNLGPMAPAGSV